jgi:hypothetical protein
MAGNEDNVGFLATGSGVQQFQLSLWGWFVFQCRRLSAQLKLTKRTRNSRALAAVPHEPGTFYQKTAIEARRKRTGVAGDSLPRCHSRALRQSSTRATLNVLQRWMNKARKTARLAFPGQNL